MTELQIDYYKDKKYISNSMLGLLLSNPQLFTLWYNGEVEIPPTPDMVIGNVAHGEMFQYISDGDYVSDYPYEIVAPYRLNTKAGKLYFDETVKPLIDAGKNIIRQNDYDNVIEMVGAVKQDPFMFDYLSELSQYYTLSFEEVFTGKYNGVLIKGKLDIVCRDVNGIIRKIIDYKTTKDINGFGYSVRKYGYDRQAGMYSVLTGLNLADDVFDFLVQDKNTHELRVFKTHRPEFAAGCISKLDYAIDKFIEWRDGDLLKLKTIVL